MKLSLYKNRIKGKSGKETLLAIRDARVNDKLNYIEIAEKFNLTPEFVFIAHMQLMKKHLLAWKPETTTKTIETIDPETKEVTHDEVDETFAVYFIPTQPEKKSRFKLSWHRKGGKKNDT